MKAVVSVSQMTITPAPGSKVYFVSDVHLGLGARDADRKREELLLRLLRRISHDAAHIFIVGDLFDAWFDYRTVVPRNHIRTLAQLAYMREQGLPITYLIGNHDFGHYTFFVDDLDIEPIGGDVDATIGNTRVYIAHGDGKAHDDRGYLLLKAILRNPLAQRMYRWLHPDTGIGLASGTSAKSRDHTDRKDYGGRDGLYDFAVQRLREGYDVVVMGHRHQVRVEHTADGTYANLGHWLGVTPTFGVFDPEIGRMDVVDVRTFLETSAKSYPEP
ncbi:MAG: UDP-2,3-diacylglucosamine diphosphatase [Candidatus Kapabacteria bacterium]|nr:UDP-2,3-diacylglucosamine diphosphatase [Candidatus Kapabacteria bacterium]